MKLPRLQPKTERTTRRTSDNQHKSTSLLLFLCLGHILCFCTIATSLYRTRCIHWKLPSLVQVDEEDNIIAETTDASHGGHADNKRKKIVDESVQTLVHQDSPWKMCHTLQFII
jgi:hypothetical protein